MNVKYLAYFDRIAVRNFQIKHMDRDRPIPYSVLLAGFNSHVITLPNIFMLRLIK